MKKRTIITMLIFLIVFSISAATARNRVLTIKLQGAIKNTTPASVTVTDLQKLPLTKYAVFDPYRKEKITYEGVSMKELVHAFGESDVATIQVRAIDGYHVEFNRHEWQKWDILFAFKENDALMGPEQNGPLKVVMPYDTSPGMDIVHYEPKWIWSITAITFTK